jgi:hypothetical protein
MSSIWALIYIEQVFIINWIVKALPDKTEFFIRESMGTGGTDPGRE